MAERCTPERRKECAASSGPNLAIVCAGCPAKDVRVSAWVDYIDGIYQFQQGGYPFTPADLPFEVWHDLGILRSHIEGLRWARPEK